MACNSRSGPQGAQIGRSEPIYLNSRIRQLWVGSGHYGDDARKTSLLSKEDSACRVLDTQ